jgi:hypothetical protein
VIDFQVVETNASLKAHDIPKVLLLSTSLLTDRMFLYTDFLPTLGEGTDVKVWAMSAKTSAELWHDASATVEPFPKFRPFREFPYNYLRRLNEYIWDYRLRPPSRLSMMRNVRDKSTSRSVRALKLPARVLALFQAERWIEEQLERLLLSYSRSDEARQRLETDRPALVVTTGPFQTEQPAIVAEARKLGIPVMALIPSWDNLSTKSRMVFHYDAYLVWSEQAKRELRHFYPETHGVPTYVIGAPQFDLLFQDRFCATRRDFCASQGLRADLPIVVYAVGSPNFVRGEYYGAIDIANRVERGELGEVQLIVRPHPIHDNAELVEKFQNYSARIVLQRTAVAGTPLNARSQGREHILEWVSTFRHADVVVNLSSTVTIDAAIFDRPVVNIDFDYEPGQPNQTLIREVNHLWTHFKPVAESGGVWLVNNPEEMMTAVRTYLRQPELHRDQRRKMAGYVCEFLDGSSGQRISRAVRDFVSTRVRKGN